MDRVSAGLSEPLLMASNFLQGEQSYFPGMADGLNPSNENYDQYLKATNQTRGLSVNDVFSSLNPAKITREGMTNIEKGNYGKGALELALAVAGTGQGKNIIQGAKTALGTESGLLSKAHYINPKAISRFNDANKSYRVAGMDNYDDMIESSFLRSKTNLPENATFAERIASRPTAFPSFQKGYADLRYLPDNKGVVFETELPTFKRGDINPVTGREISGRHYAHRAIDPTTGNVMTNIPAAHIKAYDAQPHWWKGYQELNNPYKGIFSPEDITTENFSRDLLGKSIVGNKGAYNKGIYELKQFPDRIIKFENPVDLASRSNLPEYMDFDAVAATAHLPEEQGLSKVYNQLDFSKLERGYIMPKLEGKSFENMSRKGFFNVLENNKTLQNVIDKQKMIRQNNLAFDFFGNGNMMVDKQGNAVLLDIAEPYGKNQVQGDFWDNFVQGNTNPYLYSKEEMKLGHKKVLKENLNKTYTSKMMDIAEWLNNRYPGYFDNISQQRTKFEMRNNQGLERINRAVDAQQFKKGGEY
jgi:hypothetical protein